MTGEEVAASVAVAEAISRELDEDFVGLWKLGWHLRRQIPGLPDEKVRSLAGAILQGLRGSAVRVGSLSEESGIFTPWPAEVAIDRAMQAWAALGRDPNIGEIAWLVRER